jgi:hypothetical protein
MSAHTISPARNLLTPDLPVAWCTDVPEHRLRHSEGPVVSFFSGVAPRVVDALGHTGNSGADGKAEQPCTANERALIVRSCGRCTLLSISWWLWQPPVQETAFSPQHPPPVSPRRGQAKRGPPIGVTVVNPVHHCKSRSALGVEGAVVGCGTTTVLGRRWRIACDDE